MCEEKLIPLFIYGTLIPNAMDINSDLPIVEDEIKGDMYNVGLFPAVVSGDNTIKGVIIHVTPDIIQFLDLYEGVPRLYDRKKIVTKGGRPVNYYEYQKDTQMLEKIEEGDWLSYVRG